MAKSSATKQAANNFDALFGVRQGERIVSGGFKMLAHDRITVRPQVRRTFPAHEMDELRASIRELRAQQNGIEGSGLLQALLVCTEENGYRLIAGEKRFRATQAEGLKEIPCIIVPAVSEGMTRLLQLTENSLRTAPPVLEEAQAMRETMQQQNISQRDLARLLGKNRGYIENRVRLLKMDADLQEMVSTRADTLKHAQLIAAIPDASARRELIRAVLQEEASVKELERRIAPATHPTNAASQLDNTIKVPSRDGTPSAQNHVSKAHDAAELPSRDGSSNTRTDIDDQNFKSQNKNELPSRDGSLHLQTDLENHSFEPQNSTKLPSRDGSPSPEQAIENNDPLQSSLIPATDLIDRAQRQLLEISLSHEQKTRLQQQLKTLKNSIAQIQKMLH